MASKKRTVPPEQLSLLLADFGLRQIHWRPWVADAGKFRRGRRSAQEAWDKWPYNEVLAQPVTSASREAILAWF